jgi:adenylate kinase family enzyme
VTDRILIIGGPRTGKTTLARSLGAALGVAVYHTDKLRRATWSEESTALAAWFGKGLPGPWICEGVLVPRGLRKWLADHAAPELPADIIYWLSVPRVECSPGQAAMGKAVSTVWHQVEPELLARGADVRNVMTVAGVSLRP